MYVPWAEQSARCGRLDVPSAVSVHPVAILMEDDMCPPGGAFLLRSEHSCAELSRGGSRRSLLFRDDDGTWTWAELSRCRLRAAPCAARESGHGAQPA